MLAAAFNMPIQSPRSTQHAGAQWWGWIDFLLWEMDFQHDPSNLGDLCLERTQTCVQIDATWASSTSHWDLKIFFV